MSEGNRIHKFAVSKERGRSESRNSHWRNTIALPMFRSENEDTPPLSSFPDFYRSLMFEFVTGKDSWTQTIITGNTSYTARAQLVHPIGLPGASKYNPQKPNCIYHHFADATNQQFQTRLLETLIPSLTKKYNVIAITAHGHSEKKDENGTPISKSFATMGDIQGTLAASVALIDSLSALGEKGNDSIFLGASMGGAAGLLHSMVGNNEVKSRFIIAAHNHAEEIFTSHSFIGMIEANRDIIKLREKYSNAFDCGEPTVKAIERNKNTWLYLGTEDDIVNVETADVMAKKLQIPHVRKFPLGHLSMSLALPTVIYDIKRVT